MIRRSRRRAASLAIAAIAVVAPMIATGCGVPDGDTARHRVEAETCEVLLRRSGRVPGWIDPARFAEELAALRATGRPWSTVEPFVRACRSFD